MRGLILALVLLAGCATAPPASQALMAEMQALESARNAAIREVDLPALERIYAEDFSGVAANGSLVSREQLFAVFQRARGSFGQVTSEITSARREGDLILVTGRLRIDANESQYLHVFRWNEDHWEMISGAAVPTRG
jgi:ketosteroid isomerase-like protein